MTERNAFHLVLPAGVNEWHKTWKKALTLGETIYDHFPKAVKILLGYWLQGYFDAKKQPANQISLLTLACSRRHCWVLRCNFAGASMNGIVSLAIARTPGDWPPNCPCFNLAACL